MRKNLRGMPQHLEAITNRLIVKEFPRLDGWVFVCTDSPRIEKDTLATYSPACGIVEFNTRGEREWYLSATDEELEDNARHELIHADLDQRGLPHGDNDIPFIMECLKRKVTVNDPSISAFEAQYGHGSFSLFRLTLPEPERETIMLPDGAGCWLKVKHRV